jgi:hypothetical protein
MHNPMSLSSMCSRWFGVALPSATINMIIVAQAEEYRWHMAVSAFSRGAATLRTIWALGQPRPSPGRLLGCGGLHI